jgi:hypothetical protein
LFWTREIRGHFLGAVAPCKKMPVVPDNKVVDKEIIFGKR